MAESCRIKCASYLQQQEGCEIERRGREETGRLSMTDPGDAEGLVMLGIYMNAVEEKEKHLDDTVRRCGGQICLVAQEFLSDKEQSA